MRTHCSSSMLGSAVSSRTPNDFQPNSHMGVLGSCPLMNRHAAPGPAIGCPYAAVGMQRALDSAIGLPRRSTSASWMLAFWMPAEVRSNLMMPFLGYIVALPDEPIRARSGQLRGSFRPLAHAAALALMASSRPWLSAAGQ